MRMDLWENNGEYYTVSELAKKYSKTRSYIRYRLDTDGVIFDDTYKYVGRAYDCNYYILRDERGRAIDEGPSIELAKRMYTSPKVINFDYHNGIKLQGIYSIELIANGFWLNGEKVR